MTATAISSVSADPPQILVCVNHDTSSCAPMIASGRFSVSFLSTAHSEIAEYFSRPTRGSYRAFDPELWDTRASSPPILRGAVAVLDCLVKMQQRAGTHEVLIGAVKLDSGRRG